MFLHGAKTGGGSTNPVAQLTHSSPTFSVSTPEVDPGGGGGGGGGSKGSKDPPPLPLGPTRYE